MMTAVWPLENRIQRYDWGSKTAMSQLFGLPNQDDAPQAEIWMGAHPKAPSVVVLGDGARQALDELLAHDPARLLGDKVALRFHGKLPFLFKVLSAAKPLSIQVHPSKSCAEQGYAAEELAGIPLDAPERNYRDDNHKPELVYALTLFRGLNGFRPLEQIMDLLLEVDHPVMLAQFKLLKAKREAALKPLFETLLTLKGAERAGLITKTLEAASRLAGSEPAFAEVVNLQRYYPNDVGILSPLLLNVVELQPGEAMYLDAETPHAYLEGTALEIMASSDNVLRGGLTPKHIDVKELLDNIRFVAKPAQQLTCEPVVDGNYRRFRVPVDDFAFACWTLEPGDEEQVSPASAEILFCVKGKVVISMDDFQLVLKAGQSCFIAADVSRYRLTGRGIVARAFNELG